jgi:hypothetical protein
MTKPEKKLVKQLTAVVTRQSLLEDARETIYHSAHLFSKSFESGTPAARCKLVQQPAAPWGCATLCFYFESSLSEPTKIMQKPKIKAKFLTVSTLLV